MNLKMIIVSIALCICICIPVTATTWQWCEDQDIFLWNASSDISGYKIMDNIPQPAEQSSITTASFSTPTEVSLGTWITPTGSPGVQTLGPGLWRFRVYAYSTPISGITTLRFYAINRSASGVETDLFYGKAITHDIDETVPTEHLLSYARRNYTTFFPGDRLVIRVNASTTSASARTVTMELAGNTNATMVGVSYFLCGNNQTSFIEGGEQELPITDGLPFVGVFLAIMAFAFKGKVYHR